MNVSKKILLSGIIAAMGGTLMADYPSGYYNGLIGKNQGELKTAAKNAISSHVNLGYGTASWKAFEVTDVRVINGVKYWWDMYSSKLVAVSSGHGSMNIEHSVANSWWEGTKNAAYNDIHHLNPSDSEANNRKSNYPLGIVSTVTYTNGVTTVGKPSNSSDYGGATYVYEPCDEYKGDFARVFMYMFTCYEDMAWGSRFTWMYTQGEKYPMFLPWAVNLLLAWNKADPVSDKETARNEAVYSIQNNRNPFIDLPHLAEYIWGDMKNEAFTLDGETGTPRLTLPQDGATYNFGSRHLGSSENMTIPVKGQFITEPVNISISGDSQFSIDRNSLSATEVSSGTSFSLNYNPVRTGEASAEITLSGGGLEQGLRLYVTGTGIEKSYLSPVTALTPDPLEKTYYRACWTEAPVTPDYYIVNRTYKVNGEVKTRKFMTSSTYYDFDDRDFDNDESYTVQYAVGSDISEESNAISIAAGTLGIPSVADDAFEVSCRNGGVEIVCGKANMLTITDISGRNVVNIIDVTAGSFIPLEKGIYILHSTALRRPLKIYIP